MGRAQFEYDEVGNTFYYVIVSFYAILLIPATYFFWPTTRSKEEEDSERRCHCDGCSKKLLEHKSNVPWRRTKKYLTIGVLLVAWAIFVILAYKVSQIETTHEEYDPYGILGLDQGAEVSEVKKKYRELSKIMHPDRGGDAEQFDKIAKAYQALTDDESRDNWEKYGNPDGPGVTTFGIALPKWLVSKEYGVWVLAAYGLLFMIVLPTGVGIWWYNSIKYSVDQVLMDTTQLYFFFFNKTPTMEFNRMLMILSGSFEFWKQYNKDIVERESDDIYLPPLMKELRNMSNLTENKKEGPLRMPYSMKARILLHAHLSRVPMPTVDLEKDCAYAISKCPSLLQEMVHVTVQLIMYGIAQRRPRFPSLKTLENAVIMLPMFVQAMWPKNSALQQLPHISEQHMRIARKNRVHTCVDLARQKETTRRMIFDSLPPEQYDDILYVLEHMPRLEVEHHFEVQGEDDKHEVTAGSLVTLKVTLIRHPLLDPNRPYEAESKLQEAEPLLDEDDETAGNSGNPKRKAWEKPGKKKPNKTKPGSNKNKNKPKPMPKKPQTNATPNAIEANNSTEAKSLEATLSNNHSRESDDEEKDEKKDRDRGGDDGDESDASGDDDLDDEKPSRSDTEPDAPGGNADGDEGDDDDKWLKDDDLLKKDMILETKSKKTHPVHAPHFPGDKFEWWWLYLVDKKHRQLAAAPCHCMTLIDKETVEMKFQAPNEKGVNAYSLVIKSDSYVDCEYSFDVKAKAAPPIKWGETDEEKSEQSAASSEYTEQSESEPE